MQTVLTLVCGLALLHVEANAASKVHRYTVSVDAALSVLHVEAQFSAAVNSVAARSPRASSYLQELHSCDGDTDVRIRNRRLLIPFGGIRCMSYSVDLRAAAKGQRQNRALRDDNLIVSSSEWLWRPAIDEATELLVEFNLPDGIAVAVPWRELDTSGRRFVVGKSPESANAPIAFGQFDYREIAVPGATLRVSLMNGRQAMDKAAILRWIEAAATDVSLAYGRFPNPSPQVLVIPGTEKSSSRGGAVPYGRVVRDGGESIELFINPNKPLSAFLDDWTATHEFSHLLLPYVNRQERWISEGFAQYYQNVLLARAGAYDDQRAWQKLYEGLERGRMSRPDLSPNDAAAGRGRESTMKVYWSGAAIALMADVALREQSGGEQTLDDVLRELQACCLPSNHSWSGPELFGKLDELAGRSVFMPLYQRYADAIGFPDTSNVFARLGLIIDDGRVRLARSAKLLKIRDSITELDPATANWRQQLASIGD
ncbi:MAG: hypothetical protein WBN32_08995 [Woeseia sp.]